MNDALHIACPHCDTVNRVPAHKLRSQPICGNCKQALFQAQPLELTAANFEQHVTRNDIPVLVDFWAPWCGPCRMMAPAFAQAAQLLEPEMRLAKLNTEAEQALASRFNIRSIPTLAIFSGGREIARQPGAMDATNIVRWARAQI
ncbi:MAG TPA: thioredoxin TrxC [Gallionella sp.]|nr:thioredoxin TrxC [Gallionella sp.]